METWHAVPQADPAVTAWGWYRDAPLRPYMGPVHIVLSLVLFYRWVTCLPFTHAVMSVSVGQQEA
jgi:hypothetical protein